MDKSPGKPVQIFVGDANDAEARVYASLPSDALPVDVQLVGELSGPHCRYSQTLAARIRFIDRGPGPTLLAEAIVPDPCFWTPELPFMYSAELRLSRGNAAENELAAAPVVIRRPCGIRRLGVHGTSVYLDAKRFVFRGVRVDSPTLDDMKAARDAACALYLETPDDALLQEASEAGVLLAVWLRSKTNPNDLISELERLGRWPAVGIVVLDDPKAFGVEVRQAARNTLFAQSVTAGQLLATTPSPWAHLLWWEIGPNDAPVASLPHHLPVVVYRPSTQTRTIAERRQDCDHLQADLAGAGNFSGYFT